MEPAEAPKKRGGYFAKPDGSPIRLPIIGNGMTGLILSVNDTRIHKVPKLYSLGPPDDKNSDWRRSENEYNGEIFKREKAIYERLGTHDGIIQCFKISDDLLELAYAKDGNLQAYIENRKEPNIPTKIRWILSLISAVSYIHSKRVLVDEIALRNIVVLDGNLKVIDFGQSILLPATADVATLNDGNGLTIKIEILHLGWLFYAIASWTSQRYYYFGFDKPAWPTQDQLPSADHLFCGDIIRKCWAGEYESVNALYKDTSAFFTKKYPY